MNITDKQVTVAPTAAVKVPEFHAGWQEWLAENLMKEVDSRKITAVMSRNGFAEDFIRRKLCEMDRDPVFRAGKKIFEGKRKMGTLFNVLSILHRQSRFALEFNKIGDLSPSDFYKHYYYLNRPVVLKGLMSDWKALEIWSPDYFATNFGECEVEITIDRDADHRYEDNFTRHRRCVLMKDYVRMIKEAGETNDIYLVAKNYLLTRREFRNLFDHFSCPEGFLNPNTLHEQVKLWFGPKGTVTPLHHDACSILLGQIYGRKKIKLISPFDIINVYNDRECFSAVDLENIDYDKFPLMKRVSIVEFVLEPGEFALLPIGWWHWVKSLEISISLSFTNFCGDGLLPVWRYR